MPFYFKGRANWRKVRESAENSRRPSQGGGISHRQLGRFTNIGLAEHAPLPSR
jgi:hypothetical protein